MVVAVVAPVESVALVESDGKRKCILRFISVEREDAFLLFPSFLALLKKIFFINLFF